MVISDIYPLVQSKQFDLKLTEEARIDLVLKKRPRAPKTKLTGRVTTGFLTPVNKATVKILDRYYNPVAHTLTDTEGIYIFEDIVQPGDFKLTATAAGFLTAQTVDFTIQQGIPKTINIEIEKDPAVNKGFIYGLITDERTKQPIPDTSIILLPKTGERVAETTSNIYGQYLFCNISQGEYFITTKKRGYFGSSILVFVGKGLLIKTNIQLSINPETSVGTISGRTKSGNKILRYACVGLYRVEEGSETLIQIKTTNSEGLYLFNNVNPGHYVVKAKLDNNCDYCQEFSLHDDVE